MSRLPNLPGALLAALFALGMPACTLTASEPKASTGATVPVVSMQVSDTVLNALYEDVDQSYRALLSATAATCEGAGPYGWSPVRPASPDQTLRRLQGFGLRPEVDDCEERAVYSAVLRWMQRYIVGLDYVSDYESDYDAPADNGTVGELQLRPAPIGAGRQQITRVRAAIEMPTGVLKTQWQMNGPRMIVNVELPPNAGLLLTLPTSRTEDLRVSGQSLQASGLRPLAAAANSTTTVFRLQGGASGIAKGFSFALTSQQQAPQ